MQTKKNWVLHITAISLTWHSCAASDEHCACYLLIIAIRQLLRVRLVWRQMSGARGPMRQMTA